MHLMVERLRVSNQRQKRPTAHTGRVVCCWDRLEWPTCTTYEQVIGNDILVERLSGFASQEEGVYTYCGGVSASCRIIWISPDGTDIVYLQAQSSTSINFVLLAVSGTSLACTAARTANGGYNFGTTPTLEDFLCNESPATFTTAFGGSYQATMLQP